MIDDEEEYHFDLGMNVLTAVSMRDKIRRVLSDGTTGNEPCFEMIVQQLRRATAEDTAAFNIHVALILGAMIDADEVFLECGERLVFYYTAVCDDAPAQAETTNVDAGRS